LTEQADLRMKNGKNSDHHELLLRVSGGIPEDQLRELFNQLEKKQEAEKRSFRRIPLFEEATFYEKPRQNSNYTLDISAGGLSLETQERLEVGQTIKVVLQPVEVKSPIELFGKIVREESGKVAVQFERPLPFIERIEKQRLSSFKVFEGKVFEAFKIFLQESLSNKRFKKLLRYKWYYHKFMIPFRKIRYYGNNNICPVCNSRLSKFLPNIVNSRSDARCPVCRCLERHRLDWLFLQLKTDLFIGKPKKMLHVAPENIFESKFKKLPYLQYVTADLNNPMVMYNFDITGIPFPENSFDVIYCSHVLEHVPDDRKAMREFLRILRIGGWALLQVPITGTRTFEDPSITDPYERRRLFGQEDHVRRYGPDYKNRLEEAGFKVTSYRASDFIENEEDYYRMGIQKSRMIFFCEKL